VNGRVQATLAGFSEGRARFMQRQLERADAAGSGHGGATGNGNGNGSGTSD
jgi:hypothetical protein